MINQDNPFLPNRWQCYIGYLVNSTMERNDRWFYVYVPELLPTTTGDVGPEYTTETVTVGNVWKGTPEAVDGIIPNTLTPENEETQVHSTKVIHADYFGFNTSEDVPTMYRGMQVLVLNFANSDKWYWIPLERDRSYKTFEHVRLSALDVAMTNKSADPKDDIAKRNKAITDDNTYYLEIDTKYKKRITIATASTDGEKWTYKFVIDAEKKMVEITDTSVDKVQPDNIIRLESQPSTEAGLLKGRITIANAAGTFIRMDGPDMQINVPRNLTVTVGEDCHAHVKGTTTAALDLDVNVKMLHQLSTSVYGRTDHTYTDSVMDAYMRNFEQDVNGVHQEQAIAYSLNAKSSYGVVAPNITIVSNTKMSMVASYFSFSAVTAMVNTMTTNFTALKLTTTIGSWTMMVIAKITFYLPISTIVPMSPFVTHWFFG